MVVSLMADLDQTTDSLDDSLREDITQSLTENPDTVIEPRAYTHEQVLDVVAQLQQTEQKDLRGKLDIAGFTLTPYNPGDDEDDEQACETCMYYVVHRRFCELPELMLPVEPEWSCRLWRI